MLSKHLSWGVAPALLLGAATLCLADDVSLVGDFRLSVPGRSGHVYIEDTLSARVVNDTGTVSSASVTRLPDGSAALATHAGLPLHIELRARADGGFDVAGGGRLTRQQTFPAADVERAKAFLQANAKSFDNLDCITTVNRAVRILFRDPTVRVGSQQDTTMNGLNRQGLAGKPLVIDFLNAQGKKTTGVTEPEKLRESVFQALRTLSKGERGWSVFGLSIMDGYHSVLLFLDTNDPQNPRVYWADQWSSKGGFKEYTGDELDEEIESKTNSWWSDTKKPRSRTTIWRVTPHTKGRSLVATIKAPRLNLREGPNTDDDPVGRTHRGDVWQVTGRKGPWREIISPEGEVVWAHSGYMRFERGVPAEVALPVQSGGLVTALGN
jgi:hypothetical protein